jgi:hypothetical protein
MRDDFSDNDLKSIWKNQPTEPSGMTLELLRQKARALRLRTRRELVGTVALTLIVAAVCFAGFVRIHQPALDAVFACALLWALAGQYLMHRGMWSAPLAGDAALGDCLDFYRRELELQNSLFRRAVRWSVGPFFVLIAGLTGFLVVEQRSATARMAPFLTLLVVWVVAFFAIRKKRRKELRREMDDLNAIERESRR